MKAAVLAARDGGDLADAVGVSNRALLPLEGVPMMRYVVDALNAAPTIDETVIITSPQATLPDDATGGARQFHAAGVRFADTLAAAARIDTSGLVALVTADVPLLTPEAIVAATNFALDSGADFIYTIADADRCEAAFPGTKRTGVRMREGRFTGGNIVVARVESLLRCQDTIDAFFGKRKSVLQLAMALGPGILVRLALGTLSVEHAAARGSRLIGAEVAVHTSPHPEVAFDVDKPSDLEAAKVALAAARG